MVDALLLFAHLTLVTASLWAAARARRCSTQASDASPPLKRLNALEISMTDLQSSFDSLMESHRRLRSRAGMRELRERRAPAAPPPGSDKRALMRHYGFTSVGPAFAQRQMELERATGADQSAE